MSVNDSLAATGQDDAADERKKNTFYFDRHTPEYRDQFEEITNEMQAKCPMAWSPTYNGHWVAADSKHVFELARCPVVSNHHDISGETPFQGITIPKASRATVVRGGILEMDEPEHSAYRGALNPYLSPPRSSGGCHSSTRSPAPHSMSTSSRAKSTLSSIWPTWFPRCSPSR